MISIRTRISSCTRHQDKKATVYCGVCRSFCCSDCETAHNTFFGDAHKTIPASSVTKFDPQGGKCADHNDYPLDSLCKDCLELCCSKCKWEGKHKGHNVLSLEESKDFVKETLGTSVETIKRKEPVLQGIAQESGEELECFQDRIGKAKVHDMKQFTELKEILDRKETEILGRFEEAQGYWEELSQVISDTESALGECQTMLTTGKTLLSEWESTKITARAIDKAISVVNDAKEIQRIERTYGEVHGHEAVAKFQDFDEEAGKITQLISTVPAVKVRRIPTIGPKGLRAKEVGPFFVALEWDKNPEFDDEEYAVSSQKEGEEGEPKSSLECTGNEVTISTLEPNTAYKIRVKAKRGEVMSEWSDALFVKTAVSTVEGMISLLGERSHDAEVCTKALEQLAIFTREAENSVKAGKGGAIDVILDAMRTHINNSGVCYNGCNALCNITANNGDNQVKAGEGGAIEVILNVMRKHIRNSMVCYNGCGAFCNITGNADSIVKAEEEGAIKVILNVMRTHSKNGRVCEEGCLALGNITLNADNSVKAGEGGAIEAILDVMRTHSKNDDVCGAGCRVLGNITANADNQVRAGEGGAIEVILNVMRTHSKNAGVCEYGCLALCNITFNADNRVRAGEGGAIEVILDVMRTHSKNARVCYAGCGAFWIITLDAENRGRLKRLNATDTFKEVQDKRPDLSYVIKVILDRISN